MCQSHHQGRRLEGECDHKDVQGNNHNNSTNNYNNNLNKKRWLASSLASRLHVPPMVLAVLLPFVPTTLYLNRGYTIWFHWFALAALLTRSNFLRKFAIVQGTGITLGWYAAMGYEFALHGHFFHTLYKNTPLFLRQYMVDSNQQPESLIWDTPESLVCRLITHLADWMAHPILAFVLWRWHVRLTTTTNTSEGDRSQHDSSSNASAILDWSVLLATYACSRLWSLVHTTYNQKTPGLFYVGHDVYNLDSLDGWIPAYVAEGVVFGTMVLWKLLLEEQGSQSVSLDPVEDDDSGKDDDIKPRLIASDSDLSTDTCIAASSSSK